MNDVEKKVMETIVYHDLFDFPLTAHEVFSTLPGGEREISLDEVFGALAALERRGVLGNRNGLHHLRGRGETVALRLARYDLAERKFRRVRRFFRIARYTPFLRAVFVCNTLSRSNAREDSDIDLFLVTDPGRIWTTRFFVTGLAALLRLRPTHEAPKDGLCLSFFVTSDALALRRHAIENDVYLTHWLLDLYPVYDEAGIAGRLVAENPRSRERAPGLRRQSAARRRAVPPARRGVKARIESLFDGRGARFESWAKRKQLAWMPESLKASAREGRGVVLEDDVLKLHGRDRRAEFRDRYFERIKMAIPDHIDIHAPAFS